MIDIAELEQYFPETNKPIKEGPYTFTISFRQDAEEELFVINLKIQQEDSKKDHLIKFRLGIGKDKKTTSAAHETHRPHFEIDLYKREEEAFSANIYFTFKEAGDEALMQYAKGTVVIISKIIESFIKNYHLSPKLVEKLVYEAEVLKELSSFETGLIDALYECYKNSELVVRKDGETIVVKTEHNLKKYLDIDDLAPLYLPLHKRIAEEGKKKK